MRNEALETHVVRSVSLFAVPCGRERHVFVDAGGASQEGEGFWCTKGLLGPTRAIDDRGDWTGTLSKLDHVERTSPADSTDLSRNESIDVLFEAVPDGPVGLVIGFRQTLLTTFLFYQTLAYMGNGAGDWFASLERLGPIDKGSIGGLGSVLGGIEISVENPPGTWKSAGEVRETGPLATNTVLVPLGPRHAGPLRIRLEMARGAWRLDMVALTQVEGPATAARVHPSAVLHNGSPDSDALESLIRWDRHLVTLPGDEYTLVFKLPTGSERYALFLESQGYYLEWIRAEWLNEEDPAAAAMMLLDPG